MERAHSAHAGAEALQPGASTAPRPGNRDASPSWSATAAALAALFLAARAGPLLKRVLPKPRRPDADAGALTWLGGAAASAERAQRVVTEHRPGAAPRQPEAERGSAKAESGARNPVSARKRERGTGPQDHARAKEPDRGRQARTPSEIPAQGWKDILWRVYEDVSSHRILMVAAGVTFYALLAVFPAVAALVSLYGLFADPNNIGNILQSLAGVLPGGAIDVIGDQMTRVASQGGGKLGFAFITGLAIALWSANAGMKALFDALNIVYDEQEERGFIKLNLVSLAFTLGAILFMLLALAAVVVVPIVFNVIGLGSVVNWLVKILRWPLLLVGVALGLALIYRYGPSRDHPQWRWVTWGSGAASVLWIVVSLLFSWYVSNFGSYNKTYGSLGAAIGFMTWIWLSATVVLLGADLDAQMEHQTAEDTTEGPKEPLGTRGATVADTVGEAKAS
jgi:membrane protein